MSEVEQSAYVFNVLSLNTCVLIRRVGQSEVMKLLAESVHPQCPSDT